MSTSSILQRSGFSFLAFVRSLWLGLSNMKTLLCSIGALAGFWMLSAPAQASTYIDFGVVPLGGSPSYAGVSLESSTGFNFDGSLVEVNSIGTGDMSGVTLGEAVTLTFPNPYTSGFTVTWGAYTETLTSVVAEVPSPNGISVDFKGTLVNTALGIDQPAYAIFSADQAAGPGTAIDWSLTNSNVVPTATPLPAALPLFVCGLGAIGLLGWRRKRKAAPAIAA